MYMKESNEVDKLHYNEGKLEHDLDYLQNTYFFDISMIQVEEHFNNYPIK